MYDRNNAVSYALNYALNPNPKYKYFEVFESQGGDCTNFISQCLFYGGAKMNFEKRCSWWYKEKSSLITKDDEWSVSWAIAHSLYWSLKDCLRLNKVGPKALEVDRINLLTRGDLIMYEDSKGIIYHSAIITDFYNSMPLITQHTYNAKNIPYLKSKAKKMHFMKISF